MSARGTPNGQNTQMLNGVNVNDPAAQGFSMNYYIPSAFDNIQVSTGAQDISVGTGGVFINMVTKSGSNRFNGQFLQTYQGGSTQSHERRRGAAERRPRGPTRNVSNLITNTNGQMGGPLVKNKLFYFGSIELPGRPTSACWDSRRSPPPTVPTPLASTSQQDTTDILAGEGKVNYQLGARNRFEGYLSKQRYDKPNRAASVDRHDQDSASEGTRHVRDRAAVVEPDALEPDVPRQQVSYNNTHFPLTAEDRPAAAGRRATRGLQLRNTHLARRSCSAAAWRSMSNWQYFIPKLARRPPRVQGRLRQRLHARGRPHDRRRQRHVTIRSRHAAGWPAPCSLFNSPTYLSRAVMTTALYGQDSYSLKRLTVTGGIRWERVEGLPAGAAQPGRAPTSPAGTNFTNVTIGGIVYPDLHRPERRSRRSTAIRSGKTARRASRSRTT